MSPEYNVVHQGSDISIMCFSTEPVQWYFKGQILTGNSRREILRTVLQIHNTLSNDTGTYICKGFYSTDLQFRAKSELRVGGTLNFNRLKVHHFKGARIPGVWTPFPHTPCSRPHLN